MGWGGYEIFSVLSGVALVIGAFVRGGDKLSDRVWLAVIGAAFIGYGFFVANQTSGFYVFPIEIFIIPVAGVIYVIVGVAKRLSGSSANNGQPPPAGPDKPRDW
jgi:hypothetical protein